jgi:hypothetical protein
VSGVQLAKGVDSRLRIGHTPNMATGNEAVVERLTACINERQVETMWRAEWVETF